MLARLRIGPKLLLAPGAVLVLLLLLSCVAYYAMVRQNDSLESIVGQRAASMRAASSLAAQSQKAHADIYRLLSWMGGSFPVARTEPLRQDILAQHRRIAAGLESLGKMTLTGAEDRHVEQAGAAQQRYAEAVREVIELAPLDGSISANAMQKAESAFALVAQRLADLAALEEALSREASSSAKADFRMISVLMPAVVLLAIGLSLAITFAVRRILLDEIRGIGRAASGLASGDLTLRAHLDHDYGGDEIADTSRQLDASIRNLNGTLRSILESARLIGAASRDIKLGSLSLGSRAVFRASALAHTEGALRELAADVKLGADQARAANRLAAGAGEAAHEGSDVVERLVATLEGSRRGAQRVVEIVDGLDLAASETGTLALNAALDAARAQMDAGVDAGMDSCAQSPAMAAVAGEVRALARRVAAASREIRAVAAQSLAEIDGGAAWALHAGSSMERIAGTVREVEDLAGRIGAAGEGQATHLADVGQAIVQMDQVTRQNCTLVEEAASAARTLQMQALALSRTVAGFRLEEEGARAAAPQAEDAGRKDDGGVPLSKPFDPARERRGGNRERRRHQASHLRLASSRK
ncbi:methyl-accepting chemotaxis protein [Massilia oculi]|uniref:methyl-accepting chemotaxis protein n=1 Tax=Massilia oculi TaxID=945844 RepID=UPI001AAE3C9B|nr:methyl-accepting chemotaxis protein [Massilia oculi]